MFLHWLNHFQLSIVMLPWKANLICEAVKMLILCQQWFPLQIQHHILSNRRKEMANRLCSS